MNHSNVVTHLAAGMKALPDGGQAFAHTQALWRFLDNERVTPSELVKPLLANAHAGCNTHCLDYTLVMHDWSRLNYNRHHSKTDRLQMTHQTDVGYELQTSLLVSDRDGAPICAPAQNLVTQDEVLSTYRQTTSDRPTHLDELTQRIEWLEQQGFSKRLIHIVDREADSVGHLRQWQAAGRYWMVRVKAGSSVSYAGQDLRLNQVADQLEFTASGTVDYKGQPATQWLADTSVVLTRTAKSAKKDSTGKRIAPQMGEPLSARLVISRIKNAEGECLAQWYLLSNVREVGCAQLTTWYYWRWRIESYFKLLKSGGQALEDWQQESGLAIFKRLLIASQACALVWQLMRAESELAAQTRSLLVRLSGRQMKRSQPVTASALLAGLYMLLAMCDTLEHYTPSELRAFAEEAIGLLPRRGL